MEKVTLTRVFATDKKKDGTPLMSKKGKPYTRMGIQCKEHGEKWISGFKNADNSEWKEGDVVELTLVQNGEFLNFELPFAEPLGVRVKRLEGIVQKLCVKVGIDHTTTPSSGLTPQQTENIQQVREAAQVGQLQVAEDEISSADMPAF